MRFSAHGGVTEINELEFSCDKNDRQVLLERLSESETLIKSHKSVVAANT